MSATHAPAMRRGRACVVASRNRVCPRLDPLASPRPADTRQHEALAVPPCRRRPWRHAVAEAVAETGMKTHDVRWDLRPSRMRGHVGPLLFPKDVFNPLRRIRFFATREVGPLARGPHSAAFESVGKNHRSQWAVGLSELQFRQKQQVGRVAAPLSRHESWPQAAHKRMLLPTRESPFVRFLLAAFLRWVRRRLEERNFLKAFSRSVIGAKTSRKRLKISAV